MEVLSEGEVAGVVLEVDSTAIIEEEASSEDVVGCLQLRKLMGSLSTMDEVQEDDVVDTILEVEGPRMAPNFALEGLALREDVVASRKDVVGWLHLRRFVAAVLPRFLHVRGRLVHRMFITTRTSLNGSTMYNRLSLKKAGVLLQWMRERRNRAFSSGSRMYCFEPGAGDALLYRRI